MSAAEEKRVLELAGRIPPQAIEVEEAILGSMLMDDTAVSKVIDYLDESSFYKEAHRLIYQAMVRLFDRSEPVDLITVTEELRKSDHLDRVGGTYYISGLTQKVPSASNIQHYAKIIIDKSRLRKLINVGGQIVSMAFQDTEDVDTLVDQVEQQIFQIAQDRSDQGFQMLNPVLHRAFEQIESFHHKPGGVTGVSSGYRSLDQMTSGFQNSDLIIVAGRPSMGKTALVLSIARNVAIDYKKPVGFFSLEMSSLQLVMRLLCAEAQVDAHKVRTGMLPSNDWSKLSLGVGRLSNAPIIIDDTPSLSILELRARARRLKAERQIELLIVDYMQLVTASTRANANRQEEVALISRSLKALAKEIDVPVVALSQLSRAVEQRGGEKKPMLSDLRDSGSIEQDADLVMFVHRPDYYEHEGLSRGTEVVPAEIIIGKQRNGPVGEVSLGFIKKFARFVELDTNRGQEIPPPHVGEDQPF
ncbi:MAG: replicative DNA helicase [Bacteroidetes bacterium]|nr:replicative DNA helicase [Bacteroidota bacterium]